jgi:hypothetical protein
MEDKYKEIRQKMENFNFEQQMLYTAAVVQNVSPAVPYLLNPESESVFESALQSLWKMIDGENPEIIDLKRRISEIADPFVLKDGILYENGVPWDSPKNHFATQKEAEEMLDSFYWHLPEKQKYVVSIFRMFLAFYALAERNAGANVKEWVPSILLGIYEDIDGYLQNDFSDTERGACLPADFEKTEGIRQLRIIELIVPENVPTRETIRQVKTLAEESSRDLALKIHLLRKSGQWIYDLDF